MSLVECSVLYDIEKTLDDLETVIANFDTIDIQDSDGADLDKLKSSSKLQYSIARTKNLQLLVEFSGAFPHCLHPKQQDSAMTKWVIIIDDLYWSVFGCENNAVVEESNRMKLIHRKLQKIYLSLKEYIPSSC